MNIFKQISDSLTGSASKLTRTKEVQNWLNEIQDALKREKTWRADAERTVALYEQQSASSVEYGLCEYNILYANTETLAPAVYNATPRPIVKRKVDKENPIAIAAAQVLKATLTYLVDTGDANYAPFDELQKDAAQEALVPGRGLARFTYHADLKKIPPAQEGQPALEEVEYETICGEQVAWNRVVHGYAKNWHNIPWRAYEHFMTRDECKANFGDDLGSRILLTHAPSDDKDGTKDAPKDAEGAQFAHVWEVWDKRTKEVLFLSEGYPGVIKRVQDPLKLDGFFDSPRPIQFLKRLSSLTPQTLYTMYKNQAEELDRVTRRINGLLKMMKIRGMYDGTVEGLDDLLNSDEGTLIPAKNVAAFQNGQNLQNSIWLMPLAELIPVVQQLYQNRQEIINVIHQLTGVADIMRGASNAQETLGAQEIKQAWGTMRLKRMQKEMQRFTRDCFRLQAELAAKHFDIETFVKMTGVKLPRQGEKVQAETQMGMLQQQMQQMQMAQQAGQQVPPEAGQQLQQQMAQLQQTLSAPSWEDVLGFLRNDSIRNYVIDIETNSTLDLEATEDKQELAELMNSMSQVMNGCMPMVKEGVLPFDAAKSLMVAVVQKFRFGDDVEEAFRKMQQPPPQEDPKAEAAKAEAQMRKEEHEQKMAAEKQKTEAKMALEQLELQIKREELELTQRELVMRREFAEAEHARKMQMLTLQATLPKPSAAEGGSNASA